MTDTLFGTPPPINSPDNAEATYTMSTVLEFLADGEITGIRFWGATNNIVTTPSVAIYLPAGGAPQYSELMVGPFTSAAWNTRMLTTPFAVTAGQTFHVAVGPRNRYAANTGTFGIITSGALRAIAGRFVANAALAFPTTQTTTWYGVDLLFEPATGDTTVTGAFAAGTGVANAATVAVSPLAGVSAGVGAALQPTVELEGEVHRYTFGPCEPWTPIWPSGECATVLLDPAAPAVTGVAVQAASEVLYHLTAQRFSVCRVVLRPCRRSCYGTFPFHEWWQYGSYPQPYWYAGTWYNLGCAACGDGCSCVGTDETVLPGPLHDVVEVKVDGITLTKNVNYRVDDYRKVVRIDGQLWPFCQNMNLEDTEVGTWSITADYGEVVPTLGELAVGELALEFVKYLLCGDCALPNGVVDLSRQGVSMTVGRVSDLFNTGFVNLRMCDLFIQSANPQHAKARSYVYDLDNPQPRATGTA